MPGTEDAGLRNDATRTTGRALTSVVCKSSLDSDLKEKAEHRAEWVFFPILSRRMAAECSMLGETERKVEAAVIRDAVRGLRGMTPLPLGSTRVLAWSRLPQGDWDAEVALRLGLMGAEYFWVSDTRPP